MIAGPQIISAIFLASSRDPRRGSGAYLLGAGLAIIVGPSGTWSSTRSARPRPTGYDG